MGKKVRLKKEMMMKRKRMINLRKMNLKKMMILNRKKLKNNKSNMAYKQISQKR